MSSLNTPITTTYAGEFAGDYISAALLSGVTLNNGGITIKPNVKFKEVLKKVTSTDFIADAGCDFTPTANALTLNERIIEPKELQVNLELCKQDFRSDWEAVAMGISAFDNLPPKFSDFILAHVIAKVAERTENNIWTGDDAANAGDFDGLLTLALAAGSGVPAGQKLTGIAVDSSNVIAQLGRVVDAIPSTIYGKEDLHIYVSQNIARAYVRALGGFAAAGLGGSGTNAQGTQWYTNGALTFDGVKMFVTNGLDDNQAMAAQKSNLFFGTGLLSDSNEVKILDMADLDGSQNVRVIMRYTASTQFGIADDVVTYSI
jgi:hypothetical protein